MRYLPLHVCLFSEEALRECWKSLECSWHSRSLPAEMPHLVLPLSVSARSCLHQRPLWHQRSGELTRSHPLPWWWLPSSPARHALFSRGQEFLNLHRIPVTDALQQTGSERHMFTCLANSKALQVREVLHIWLWDNNAAFFELGRQTWSAFMTTKRALSASCCATCFASTALVNCR